MLPNASDVTRSASRAFRSAKRRGPPPGVGLAVGAVAVLAAAAVANLVAAKRSERRHPPQGAFLEIDGVRLHYTDQGEGAPIVLIHGNGVTSEDWALSGLSDRLAKTHRVIAFDRPGFGYSQRPRTTIWTAKAQAELLRRALRQPGVSKPLLVGHSWGTLVAMSYALEHQDELAGVVLMSGYYRPTPRPDVPLMSGPAVPVVGDLMRFTISPLIGWLITPLVFKSLFSPSKVPVHFKAGFPTGMALRPTQIRASAADTGLMVPEAAKTVGRHGELTLPVLIIAGTGDKIVSYGHQSAKLASEVPQSRLHPIENTGHMIHHVATAEVADAILAFAA